MMMTKFAAQKAVQTSYNSLIKTARPSRIPSINLVRITPPKLKRDPYIFELFDEDYELEESKLENLTLSTTKQTPTNQCYALMRELRKNDISHKDLNNAELVDLLFPKTSTDLVLSLSNVTAVFYGTMLLTIGNTVGMDKIDQVSKDFFYNLGQTLGKITKGATDGQYDLPKDARGVAIALITAIYKASPEYKFEVTHFDKDFTQIDLKGADRYLRVAKQMGFSEKLEWPVLHRFMEGISDELKANVDVKSEMLEAKDNGECHERFTMTTRNKLR